MLGGAPRLPAGTPPRYLPVRRPPASIAAASVSVADFISIWL